MSDSPTPDRPLEIAYLFEDVDHALFSGVSIEQIGSTWSKFCKALHQTTLSIYPKFTVSGMVVDINSYIVTQDGSDRVLGFARSITLTYGDHKAVFHYGIDPSMMNKRVFMVTATDNIVLSAAKLCEDAILANIEQLSVYV